MVQGATVLTLDSSALQAAGGSYTLTEGINSGYGNFSVTMALDAQAFQDAILAGNVKANIFSANNNMIGLGLQLRFFRNSHGGHLWFLARRELQPHDYFRQRFFTQFEYGIEGIVHRKQL